jgi:hypothetical protein
MVSFLSATDEIAHGVVQANANEVTTAAAKPRKGC